MRLLPELLLFSDYDFLVKHQSSLYDHHVTSTDFEGTTVGGDVVSLLGHLERGDRILQLGSFAGILQMGLCLAVA